MFIRSGIFISVFMVCTFGAIFAPHFGIYGYIADYCIGPAQQWWEAPFSQYGIRYSFTLALATALGMVLQSRKLRFGSSILMRGEVLLILFLSLIWLSTIMSDSTIGRYSITDHPSVKFTKMVIFCLMMTHIITDQKKMDNLLWVLILAALILGLQAWEMPRRAFVSGRLEGVGGSDFAESNFLGAFMAAMLPIIGIQLIKAKNLYLKAVCVLSAAFTSNAVILVRSRGALVGLVAGGVAALMYAPKKYRLKIILGLIIGCIGFLYVADKQFLDRISTIIRPQQERDVSALSRFKLWEAAGQMVSDFPLGIGVGNWYQTIESYIPEYAGKDAHSTYAKCAAEMGYPGIILFCLILLNAYLQLRNIKKQSQLLPPPIRDDLVQLSFALTVSLVIILVCGLTITMIYIEVVWILLMLPVCLRRVLDNALIDQVYSQSEVNDENK